MKISKPFHKTTWVPVVSALLFFAGTCAAQSRSPVPIRVGAMGGLQLSISLDESATSNHPVFRVELQNTGSDLLLHIGTLATSNDTEYPTAIALVLVGPDGKFLQLEPITDKIPQQPLLLPLPSGATYSIPVNLENYRVAGSDDGRYDLTAGAYSIRAEFTDYDTTRPYQTLTPSSDVLPPSLPGKQRPMPIVAPLGALISNTLKFQVSK